MGSWRIILVLHNFLFARALLSYFWILSPFTRVACCCVFLNIMCVCIACVSFEGVCQGSRSFQHTAFMVSNKVFLLPVVLFLNFKPTF